MLNKPELADYDLVSAASDDDGDADDAAGTDPLGAFREMADRYNQGDADDPRVVMAFPTDPSQMLLSGTLGGGEALAGRAQVVDVPLGEGHLVMFSIRPFWRWQTQGTFFLGFNAILNWNDLDAGRPAEEPDEADDSN